MINQLQPREQFPVVRQLADHTDVTTYYVKATVRDSRTDAILDTLQLTSQGSGRFSYVYQVPPDVSGLGRHIDITTEVYTDSVYTSKASTYGDENNSYLVFDRMAKIGGGGGGSDVDYKKIAKLMAEALKTITIPAMPDLSPLAKIMASLDTLRIGLTGIKTPEPQKLEYGPVLSRIEAFEGLFSRAITVLADKVGSIKFEQKDTDLSPVLEKLAAFDAESITTQADNVKKAVDTLVEALSASNFEKLEGSTAKIGNLLNEFLLKVSTASPSVKKEDSMASRAARILGK